MYTYSKNTQYQASKNNSRDKVLWMYLFRMPVIMLILALSFLWEFLRLYQQKVSEQAATIVKGVPRDCDPQSMSWKHSVIEYFRYFFSWTHSADECKLYYYALLVNPVWEVSPLLVITSLFSRCIQLPFEMMCSSLGRGLSFFFLEIPSHWQPVVLIVVTIIGLLLLLMGCHYRIHMPMIFKLEPNSPQRKLLCPRTRKLALKSN